MREIDELRPLTAARLLAIRRDLLGAEEAERGLLGNGQVLAECCFCRGERVFSGSEEVLETLTAGEMERLLERLAAADRFPQDRGGGAYASDRGENGTFDEALWRRLGGGA